MNSNQTFAAAAIRQGRVFYKFYSTLLFLFLLHFLTAQNQQRKWFQNSKDVDFTANPPTVATTSGVAYETSAWQKATNGVHDHQNAWLFSINGAKLYSPVLAGYNIFPNGSFDELGADIAICPKPGSCDSFYVFHSRQDNHWYGGTGFGEYNLDYHLIDKNQLGDPDYLEFFMEHGHIYNYDGGNLLAHTPTPLAVSKEKILSSVKTRQLFYIEWTGLNYSVKRIDITPTGLSSPSVVYSQSDGLNLSGFEMELSPDGSMLALARCRLGVSPSDQPTKDIVIYHLNSNGTLNTALGSAGVTYVNIPHATNYEECIVGLEFSPNSQRLFTSVANDLIYYATNLTTTPTIAQINGTQDFTFSQMEWINNGGVDYIAVAKNETEVYKINNLNPPLVPTISTTPLYSNTYVPRHIFFNLNVNGATNKNLLCLPDQVDGDNYTGTTGGWFSPMNSQKCCMDYYANTAGKDVTVTTSTTWTPTVVQTLFGSTQPVFDGVLTVNPGVTLTLQGVTLRFQPNARMVIKQGAQVNLYGSTLTGLSCGLMWQGVRVWGNSSQAQTSTQQGILNIAASGVRSKIENAWCAVALYNKEGDPGASTTAGGMITGAFTDFLNNWQDIDFKNYSLFSSGSNVRYCTFIVDNNYLTSTYSHRVILKNISGIRFWASTFGNDKSSFQTGSNTMEGIHAEDANFTVDRYLGAGAPLFRNFLVAVRSNFLTTQRPYTCNYATFNNNMYGVLSEGVNNFTTTFNTFNIGFNGNFLYNAGLYVNTGTGFAITSNTFQGNTSGNLPISVGCYVFNSGQNQNLINKNIYNALWEANGAENVNKAAADNIGLFYQCNTQSQDLLDLYVSGGSLTGQNYGIRENHFTTSGSSKISPMNTFSQNSSVYNGHQWNDIYLDQSSNLLDNIIYKYNTSTPLSRPLYVTSSPATPYVDVNTADVTTNPCSGGGGGMSGLMASGGVYGSDEDAYYAAKSAYETANYLYLSLIDNGNTTLLKQSIDVWGQDAWNLRNQLIAKSPNLSGEVIEYIAKEGTLPSALLFDVCMANLGSVKEEKLLRLLQSNEIAHPLTAYMADILRNAEVPESYRTILEAALNNAVIDYHYIANARIAEFLANDIAGYDSAKAVIAVLPSLGAKYALSALELSGGHAEEAITVLDNLEQNSNVGRLDPHFSDYKEFMSYVANNLNSLTNGQVLADDIRSYLEGIAANHEHPGSVMANNLLRADGNWTYTPLPKFPNGSDKKEFEVVEKIQFVPRPGIELNLYPNPATEYVVVDLNYFTNSTLTAEVIDYTGKVLSSNSIIPSKNGRVILSIETAQFPTGNYILTIKEGPAKLISKAFTKN